MSNETIQTFLIITDRARQAGLIQFAEMPVVLKALQEAEELLKPQPVIENGNPAPDEAGPNKD